MTNERDPSKPVPPALLGEPSAEEDAPRPRRPTNAPARTEILDAVTRPHAAAIPKTAGLPVAPVRLVIGPTEHVDGPTTMLPAAEAIATPVGRHGGPPDTTRIAAAAMAARTAAEAMEVDGKAHLAQLFAGISAALVGAAPVGALEIAACRLTKDLFLVDAGIGGSFGNEELARLLVEIATTVLVGVDPYRRAALDLARHCETRAASYRQAAKDAWIRGTGAEPETVERVVLNYEARADELEAQVRHLRQEAS